MSSELSDRVDRLERRADVQLQQTGDCKAAICRLAELVRRLKAEVYKDPEVPDAPPPVATDHDLYMAFSGNRDTAAALRAIYNLGRQHGADQLCPYIRSDDEGTSYCALAEQAAPAVEGSLSVAPLLWVLWHHLGANSSVGQPIREYLRMGRFQPMSKEQVESAKEWRSTQSALANEERSAPAPAGSLVERVAGAMGPSSQAAMDAGELPYGTARAAIREVAAWLRKSDAKLEMGGDAAATADLLEQEAKR